MNSSISIQGIPIRLIPQNWDKISLFIGSIAERSFGRWSLKKIKHECHTGSCQVWVIKDNETWKAIFITSIEPQSVDVLACVGSDRHLWQDKLVAKVEDWTKQLGKKYVIMSARIGWLRFLKHKGYHTTHCELMKTIS